MHPHKITFLDQCKHVAQIAKMELRESYLLAPILKGDDVRDLVQLQEDSDSLTVAVAAVDNAGAGDLVIGVEKTPTQGTMQSEDMNEGGGAEHTDGGEEDVQGEDDKITEGGGADQSEGEGRKIAGRDGPIEGGGGADQAEGDKQGEGDGLAEEGEGSQVMAATVILGPAELTIGIDKPLI